MDARNHRKVRLNPELIQLSASKLTANARQRFAEMSAVTGPQVSSVSLVLSLIGTITGNRALAVPARAHSDQQFHFEAS